MHLSLASSRHRAFNTRCGTRDDNNGGDNNRGNSGGDSSRFRTRLLRRQRL
jgi:hypothetical protein